VYHTSSLALRGQLTAYPLPTLFTPCSYGGSHVGHEPLKQSLLNVSGDSFDLEKVTVDFFLAVLTDVADLFGFVNVD
jgi:hypothetical protein